MLLNIRHRQNRKLYKIHTGKRGEVRKEWEGEEGERKTGREKERKRGRKGKEKKGNTRQC